MSICTHISFWFQATSRVAPISSLSNNLVIKLAGNNLAREITRLLRYAENSLPSLDEYQIIFRPRCAIYGLRRPKAFYDEMRGQAKIY